MKVETLMTGNENSQLDEIVKGPVPLEHQIQSKFLDVKADEKFYNAAAELCKILEIVLKEKFKKPVNVKLFGSAATHLALKNSDMDLYLDFGNHLISKKRLKKFFRKLRKKHQLFENIQLEGAAVPIFKSVTYFGLYCDISNPFGVYASDLINFLFSVNDRIQQLIVLLKFWLKQLNLYCGKWGKIGGYALVSLVIFYLQQCEEPVLPSIYSLQTQCDLKEMREGWIVSFARNPSQISMMLPFSKNLKNFFYFYSEFDFENKIVSPFLGKEISKKDFCSAQLIPSEFECLNTNLVKDPKILKKFEGLICVQDFIVHSRNVTIGIGRKTINKLQHACLIAYTIIEKEGGDCGSDLFHKLFKQIYYREVQVFQDVSTVEVKEILKHEAVYAFKNEPSEKTFRIIQVVLKKNENDNQINTFFTFLYNLLTKIMKCEVVIRDENNVKTYECKIDSRHILDKSYRKNVLRYYQIWKRKTTIEVAECLNNPLFSANQDIKPEINRSAFEIVCIVKDSPFRIECQFISKEGIKSRRGILHQNLDGLVFVLMKCTKWEV